MTKLPGAIRHCGLGTLSLAMTLIFAGGIRAQEPAVAPGLTTIYTFTGPDGAYPLGALLRQPDGGLIGFTGSGGDFDGGTVFQLKPPGAVGGAWSETVLHSFGLPPDGEYIPFGTADGGVKAGRQGRLYGATDGGGTGNAGTVFQLTPPSNPGEAWSESVLYNFSGFADGALPESTLVVREGSPIYGTTFTGGALTCIIGGCGTFFKLQPPAASAGEWTETVVLDFGSPSFAAYGPYGPLLRAPEGSIYGISYGPAAGAVFQLKPPAAAGDAWTGIVIHSFGESPGDGTFPEGLSFGPVGVLYGTTNSGGDFGQGTVYSLTPPSEPGGAWSEASLTAALNRLGR